MRTLQLTIAYDGTRYAGWQTQRRKPTIQDTLERVLSRILQEPVHVVASGRTDAGVHALAQSAHVRVRSAISCRRLLRSVNQLLPPDVAVTRIADAPARFHARFDARRKRYRYRLFTGAVVPPFIHPYVCQVRAPLNVSLMRREAAALRGAHDFRGFARLPRAARHRSTRRVITDIRLLRRGDELQVEVEGNGFLHTMVRSMVGTLVDVGRGRLPAGTVRRMLSSRERRLAGATAPARGLSLVAVDYGRRHD